MSISTNLMSVKKWYCFEMYCGWKYVIHVYICYIWLSIFKIVFRNLPKALFYIFGVVKPQKLKIIPFDELAMQRQSPNFALGQPSESPR